MDGWKLMGWYINEGDIFVDNGINFGLKFLMILFSFKDTSSSCAWNGFRKDGMYGGCDGMGGDEIDGNELYETRFSIVIILLIKWGIMFFIGILLSRCCLIYRNRSFTFMVIHKTSFAK